jgi:tetratricopeptide (TPR) repeat protein
LETIDIKILEARKKPLTPENLNYLGDLYLKKEETEKAIDYYYKAAEQLSYVQKDKKIAIFKKILKIAPSDLKAYEGIINILARLGIIADEIKYSYVLADLYHKNGQFDHARLIYSRIQELDPPNKVAENYLHSHEEVVRDVEPREDIELIGNEQAHAARDSDDSMSQLEAVSEVSDAPEEQDNGDQSTMVIEVKGRAAEGLFSASIEGAPLRKPIQEKRAFYVPEKRNTYQRTLEYCSSAVLSLTSRITRRMLVYGGVGLIFLLLLTILVSTIKDSIKPSEESTRDRFEAVWINNNILMKTNNYEINITRLTEELLDRDNPLGIIDEDIQKNYDFFTISVSPLQGCLPEGFVVSPHSMISLLTQDGTTSINLDESDLKKLNKIIYKANICNKEFAPVFIRFYINQHKELRSSALSMKGLEKGYPLIIEW